MVPNQQRIFSKTVCQACEECRAEVVATRVVHICFQEWNYYSAV